MKYKHIIFDLGAVLFDINYQYTTDAFVKLGLTNFDAIYSKQKQQHFFDQFERGEIGSMEFRKTVRQYLPESTTDDMIDSAWNAMLIGIPEARYGWLEQLSKQRDLFLLSNTNEVHIAEVKQMIDKQYGFDKFEQLFIKTYYSCELGLRKPEPEIFEKVIADNRLNKSQTLFIDDSPQHIVGATSVGIKAIHLTGDMQVEDLASVF